jgi:CDGSH-type Zn-finger protein
VLGSDGRGVVASVGHDNLVVCVNTKASNKDYCDGALKKYVLGCYSKI